MTQYIIVLNINIADDADANLDDNAGKLTFLARTCVQYNVYSIN